MLDLQCPISQELKGHIQMAHGSGGRRSHELLRDIFRPAFANPILLRDEDAAITMAALNRWAIATDAHVVRPLFFAGGDLGKLSILGCANDLAMMGARAKYMTLSWILEEGLAMQTLHQIVQSAAHHALSNGISVVAGDTKVVERGHGDQIYISCASVGEIEFDWKPQRPQGGDMIIVSGDLGRHGIAVLAARNELGLQTRIESDCEALYSQVDALLKSGVQIRMLRDLTRGGLAAAAWEIAKHHEVRLTLEEIKLPVCAEVRGACELLGLDPIHIANEGRFIAIVAPADAERALTTLRNFHESAYAIGVVSDSDDPGVVLQRPFGGQRWLELPAGDPLPRIC